MVSFATKTAILLAVFTVFTEAHAENGDIHLKCTGTQESDGSNFRANTKPLEFDMKVNVTSKRIEGGLSELITATENFSAKVTDSEFIGSGHGKSSLRRGASVVPVAILSLNRHTGSYSTRMLISFEDGSWTEYKIQASCEVAARKF